LAEGSRLKADGCDLKLEGIQIGDDVGNFGVELGLSFNLTLIIDYTQVDRS
jgi:hypothetical protein